MATPPLSTGPGPTPTIVTHETLLEHEGPSVAPVLVFPVIVTAAGVVLGARSGRPRRSHGVAAGVLWAFAVIGAASVGPFYVPAALAMTAAARFAPHGPVWQSRRGLQ